MSGATKRIVLLGILGVLGVSPLSSKSAATFGTSVGVLISGPTFMTAVNGIPIDRLREADTSDQSAVVTFNEKTSERDLTIRVAVIHDSGNSSGARVAEQALFERIFRDDAVAACNGPIRFSRSAGRPN